MIVKIPGWLLVFEYCVAGQKVTSIINDNWGTLRNHLFPVGDWIFFFLSQPPGNENSC